MNSVRNFATRTSSFSYPRSGWMFVGVLVGMLYLVGTTARADQTVYKKVLPSTVFIVNKSNFGTGFVVDAERRWVVTACHVVENHDTVLVHFPLWTNGKLIVDRRFYLVNRKESAVQARVVFRLKSKDLAILELPKLPRSTKAIQLARDSAGPGESVHVVGNQGGLDALWIYTHGKVRTVMRRVMRVGRGTRAFVVDAKVVMTDLPTNPGDSGGPVVNDKAEVVALVSSADNGTRLVSNFVDVSEIRTMLQNAKVKGQVRRNPVRQAITILGRWVAYGKAKDGTMTVLSVDFHKDGTYDSSFTKDTNGKTSSRHSPGTYSYRKGTLTLQPKNRTTPTRLQVLRLNEQILTVEDVDGLIVTFERKLNAPRQKELTLAGTTWTGGENLEGYGKLVFEFERKGLVVMIDTEGRHAGTWKRTGNNMTLTFYDGQVSYAGKIEGAVFSGTATNQEGVSWRFEVKGNREIAND
ncbi:MAG: serine protease [Gemmataceae bacterium]